MNHRSFSVTLALLAVASSLAQPPAPTKIDDDYAKAVRDLADRGLSNPSKGKFSRVEVQIGNATGRRIGEAKATYPGWVLPGGKYAVLLDGLKYRIDRVIGDLDLETELFGPTTINLRRAWLSPLDKSVPALLILANRPDLALKAYARTPWNAGRKDLQLYRHLLDRYRMQSADALIHRQDKEAEHWAKLFKSASDIRVANKVEPPADETWSQLDVQEPARLYADTKRRVAHPKPAPDLVKLKALPQEQRIPALIEALDEVTAYQMSQPGSIWWSYDPLFQLIVNEGEAIVPALIEAIENDERYTRSVGYHRDFFSGRTIATARNAAWQALNSIWTAARIYDHIELPQRGPALKEAWRTSRLQTEAERWLTVLRDDRATGRSWTRAAEFMTSSERLRRFDGGGGGSSDGSPVFFGEPLRKAHGDEVSTLLAKRAIQIMETPANYENPYAKGDEANVAHCLAQWDPPASGPTVMTVCVHVMNIETDQRHWSSMLIADLCKANNPSAAPIFALFASKVNLSSQVELSWFRPLWTSPNNAAIQKAGAELFDRLTREMQEATPEVLARSESSFSRIRASRLLTLPYFRKFVASGLWERDVFGEATVGGIFNKGVAGREYISIGYHYLGGGTSGTSLAPGSVGLPEGTKMPLSLDMSVASSLSWLKGAPPFNLLDWKADHNEAMQAIYAWLVNPKTDWDAIVAELIKDEFWFER